MKSMTGFGNSETTTAEGKVTVEARSENHRFLDVKLHVPEYLGELEATVNEIVKKQISRGKIKVSVNTEDQLEKVPEFNKKAAQNYYTELVRLKKELKVEGDITIDHILMFRDIFNGNQNSSITKTTLKKIGTAARKAISNLEKSRRTEGKKLLADLNKRIKKCHNLVEKIKKKRSAFTEDNFKRIKERADALLEDQEIDSTRLYQEIAILSERSDITEEIVRLQAHLEQFSETTKKTGPVGKELDFLILEMNREASTISAKSKDADISHFTINLRSEFEKMREQVQNIE